LFYFGIGLTVIYSLRLIKLFCEPSVHMALLSTSFSCSMTVKAPLFWLSRLSIFQGTFFNFNCCFGPAFLCYEDKLFIWGLLIVRLVRVSFLVSNTISKPRPFAYLCYTTSLLRLTSRAGSCFSYTEVSAFHGGGLVQMPSLVMPIGLGSHFFNKLTLTLFIAILML